MNDENAPHTARQPGGRPPGLARRLAGWVAHKFLVLWYVGTDPLTPRWAKVTLFGALLYIFPFGVPLDFLPPIGEEFDLGAMLLAFGTFLFSIRRRHLNQARAATERWFSGHRPLRPPEPPVIDLEAKK